MTVLTDGDAAIHLFKPGTKFRRRPKVMPDYAVEQATCEDGCGHVLSADKGDIICTECGARWHDEGF